MNCFPFLRIFSILDYLDIHGEIVLKMCSILKICIGMEISVSWVLLGCCVGDASVHAYLHSC